MAKYDLINQASATGRQGDDPIGLDSIPVITVMTDELSINKVADKSIWATGELTYTITMENRSEIAYTDVELHDELDAKITLVDASVKINGVDAVKDVDYTFIGRKLKVLVSTVPAKVGDEAGKAVVMFRVSKVS